MSSESESERTTLIVRLTKAEREAVKAFFCYGVTLGGMVMGPLSAHIHAMGRAVRAIWKAEYE
jgi:hypothetical protein